MSSRVPRAGHRYELPVPLSEGLELVSLFIEAFPVCLMGDKKIKKTSVFNKDNKIEMNPKTRHPVCSYSPTLSTPVHAQYTHTPTQTNTYRLRITIFLPAGNEIKLSRKED